MTTPPGSAAAGAGASDRQVARDAGRVGAATVVSRLLGLARDQVMAALFGAGYESDAFNTAFRLPNLLRDLFAEGAMSASFIPTFTEYDQKRGAAEAWALGRQLMMTLLAVLLGMCVLGWLFTQPVVHLLAGGFERFPGKLELTGQLFRIMLPFLPFVALAAAAMGMLNARGVFGVPALAPALLNAGMIAFGLALIPACRAIGQPPIVAMAVGVVLGAALQFGGQLPSLARQGFRFRFEWPTWHPGVRRVALLMLPATIGLAATNINILVSSNIASHLAQGSVTWLYCAFRLMQLPIGVFGIATATVSMPALSRAAVNQDMAALKSTLSGALRLVLLLTVPAAAFMAVASQPVIAALFEHGRFHADATGQTAGALIMYCIGLPAFASIGVLTRTFYALGDTRTPMQASLVAVALNVTLNLLLIGPLRGLGLAHRGLALATSLTAVTNLAQLAFYLRRRIGSFEERRIAATFARVAGASLAMGAGVGLALLALGGRWHHGTLPELATVAGLAVLGAALGAAFLRVARVEELSLLDGLGGAIRRRLRR